jgi:hypothetical protein
MVLPQRTTTDPSACLASLPVSMDTVLPSLSGTSIVIGFGFIENNSLLEGCFCGGSLKALWGMGCCQRGKWVDQTPAMLIIKLFLDLPK